MIIIIFVIFLNESNVIITMLDRILVSRKKGGSVPLNQGLCDILVGVIFLFLFFFISSFKI